MQVYNLLHCFYMSDGRKFEFNWPFFGNRHIIDFLQGNILNRELSHFYIFSGTTDLGKGTLAQHFAASVLCRNFTDGKGVLPCGACPNCQQIQKGIHSDVSQLEVAAGKKNISIEQIRDFIRLMNLGSFAGSYKIGIIKEAESLSLEAANALLKTLEEPKPGVIIILLTSMLEQLPATVISRGQILLFRPAAREHIYDYLVKEHKAPRTLARTLARISSGRPSLAAKFFGDREFFNQRRKLASSLIKIMAAAPSERWRLQEDLLQGWEKGNETKSVTLADILEIWQTLVRDLLLLLFGLEELVANELFSKELKELNLKAENLLKLEQNIAKSRQYLSANVNPRLVLESLSLQI